MKLTKQFMVVMLTSLSLTPVLAAVESPNGTKESIPIEVPNETRVQVLTERLEEIKAMDIKTMSKLEKRELRKEVRSIKKEMNALGASNGVYISIGAILIIVLLLILLL